MDQFTTLEMAWKEAAKEYRKERNTSYLIITILALTIIMLAASTFGG